MIFAVETLGPEAVAVEMLGTEAVAVGDWAGLCDWLEVGDMHLHVKVVLSPDISKLYEDVCNVFLNL